MSICCETHRWQFFRPTTSELAVRCLDCGLQNSSNWWFDAHLPAFMPTDDDEWSTVNGMLIDQGFDRLTSRLTPA